MKAVMLGFLGTVWAGCALAQESTLPVGTIVYDAEPAPLITQSQASVRSFESQPVEVEAGIVTSDQITPLVDLAPGETIVQMIAVPSIVRVPAVQPEPLSFSAPVTVDRVAPEPVIDPVTGRLRDTEGWTGRNDAADGVACFPCD